MHMKYAVSRSGKEKVWHVTEILSLMNRSYAESPCKIKSLPYRQALLSSPHPASTYMNFLTHGTHLNSNDFYEIDACLSTLHIPVFIS